MRYQKKAPPRPLGGASLCENSAEPLTRYFPGLGGVGGSMADQWKAEPMKGNNRLDSVMSRPLSCSLVMKYAIPEFSHKRVDAAGELLVSDWDDAVPDDDYDHAYEVFHNWRASYSFPLNTMQVGLRSRVLAIDKAALVGQRLKRFPSIHGKLMRFPWMKLSRMQDIGGARAIMSSLSDVQRLVDEYKGSSIKHKLVDENDYIAEPRDSGYRGIHLVYRYYSDRKPTYNGHRIELQLRSTTMHSWATTVETAETFQKQAFKASQGNPDWLRFFALMGSRFAVREGTGLVPGTPDSERELDLEIREYAAKLNVLNVLRTYREALNPPEESDTANKDMFLMVLEADKSRLRLRGFSYGELGEALRLYSEAEEATRTDPNTEAVLVRVSSLEALKRTYPNYFLDTETFLEEVQRAIA